MLSENTLNALPEAIYQRLNAINTECLNRIGQKVKEIGQLSRGDSRKLQRIQTYGAEDIERELERITAKNTREIYGIIDAVAKDIYTSAAPLYDAKGLEQIPYAENRNLLRYVESIARQTVGEYINLTQHTAFCIFGADGTTNSFFKANSNKIPTSLSETYTRVIDEAVTAAQTGLTDYYSAMRRTMKALADSGVRTVDYATGYSRRLDTSVRQNVLWGVKQCAQGVSDQVGEELGTDGWEISYHSNPRPSHEDMGGRQYTAGDTGVTISGKYYPPFKGGAESPEALLKDYNCLHYKFPILLGISEPVYDDDELAALKANDKRTIEYEGKTYTGYEATQVQRKLETEIRRQKDRANLAAACGDDDMRREAQEKINQLTRHYANFSKAAGLPTHMERMRVAGFHRVKSTSEVAQALRAPFPKGYTDTRRIGKPITESALSAFSDKATRYGIKLMPNYGAYGGFETYRGDPKVLDEALEHIKTNQELLTKRGKDATIVLQYRDLLDDQGRIDTETFAMIKGNTLTLNRFMYDDTDFLKREYDSLMQSGHFAKGTDYRNVIDHEMGHIIAKRDRTFANRVKSVVNKLAEASGTNLSDFVRRNISKYADSPGELLPEIIAQASSKSDNIATKILEEVNRQ